MENYTRKVVLVKRVVDGDTVDLVVDLGYTITVTDRFRMEGYDAPETYAPKIQGERAAGTEVKEYLAKVLEEHSNSLFVRTKKTGKYGRYIATIFFVEADSNIVSVNDLVVAFMAEKGYIKEALRAKEITDGQ